MLRFLKPIPDGTQYDVQVKAVKPSRVVTLGRFTSLRRARSLRDKLKAIGFEVIIHSPRGWDELS